MHSTPFSHARMRSTPGQHPQSRSLSRSGKASIGVLAAAAVATAVTGVGVSTTQHGSATTAGSAAHAPAEPFTPQGTSAPGTGSLNPAAFSTALLTGDRPNAAFSLLAFQVAAAPAAAPAAAHAAPAAAHAAPASAAKPTVAHAAGASVVTTHDRHVVSALSTALRRLRTCESGGNYRTASGNGYFGAYQFDLSTWRSLGLSGLPSHASHQLQDVAVTRLEARKGWGPWPVCSRVAGLR